MRFILSVILFMSLRLALWAGPGDRGYEFLSLPVSSRVSALGGANVSVQNNDLNMVSQNPSMLSGELNRALAVNYFNHIAGVNYGNVAYSQSIDSVSFWAGCVSYLNYGTFEGYSELVLASVILIFCSSIAESASFRFIASAQSEAPVLLTKSFFSYFLLFMLCFGAILLLRIFSSAILQMLIII